MGINGLMMRDETVYRISGIYIHKIRAHTPRVLSLYCIDCDCIEFEIRELDSAEG